MVCALQEKELIDDLPLACIWHVAGRDFAHSHAKEAQVIPDGSESIFLASLFGVAYRRRGKEKKSLGRTHGLRNVPGGECVLFCKPCGSGEQPWSWESTEHPGKSPRPLYGGFSFMEIAPSVHRIHPPTLSPHWLAPTNALPDQGSVVGQWGGSES